MAWGRAGLVVLAGWVLGKFVLPTAYPFFLAILVAFALDPVVGSLERRGLSRSLASFVAVFGGLGLAALLMAALLSLMWSEAEGLLVQLPGYYHTFHLAFLRWGQAAGLLGPGKMSASLLQTPLRGLFGMATGVLSSVAQGAAAVPEVMLEFALAMIAAFFLSRDKASVRAFLETDMNTGTLRQGRRVGMLALRSSVGYVKAQLVLLLTTAVLVTTGLALLGSRYAIILGLAAGMLDVVPMLGPATILAPWAAYLLLTGHITAGLRLVLLAGAVVSLRELVEMKVVGMQVGLHPLAALLAMYFGVKLFGGLGIALGPIILATSWAAGRSGIGTSRI